MIKMQNCAKLSSRLYCGNCSSLQSGFKFAADNCTSRPLAHATTINTCQLRQFQGHVIQTSQDHGTLASLPSCIVSESGSMNSSACC